jgi:anthranilate synthase component 1
MKQYDYKTISRTMLGDLHTPVSTYLKVRDIFPQSALMESSDYHGSENNRSFIALCPLASVSIDHGTAIFRLPDDSREEHPITEEYRVETH